MYIQQHFSIRPTCELIVCFRVDYWMCATEMFVIHATILNYKTSFSLKYINQDNQI